MVFQSQPVRVVVIGAGHVGATFAYALLFRGLAAEIVLIDANHARAEGEAMDINHAEPFTNPHAGVGRELRRLCRSGDRGGGGGGRTEGAGKRGSIS